MRTSMIRLAVRGGEVRGEPRAEGPADVAAVRQARLRGPGAAPRHEGKGDLGGFREGRWLVAAVPFSASCPT